jgi:hypothetical protein
VGCGTTSLGDVVRNITKEHCAFVFKNQSAQEEQMISLWSD